MKTKKLTPKQARFVDFYMETGNATEAARRAGYSEKRASEIGYQILQKTTVQEAIKERNEVLRSERICELDEVLSFWSSVIRGEVMSEKVAIVDGIPVPYKAPASLMERLKASEFRAKAAGAFLPKVEIGTNKGQKTLAELMMEDEEPQMTWAERVADYEHRRAAESH